MFLLFSDSDTGTRRSAEDNAENAVDVANPDRFNRMEPDLKALRYYLESGRRQHICGISQVQRVTVGRQAKLFHISASNGKLMYERGKNKIVYEYIETKEARNQCLDEIHRYS